jgi:hypothetical protein
VRPFGRGSNAGNAGILGKGALLVHNLQPRAYPVGRVVACQKERCVLLSAGSRSISRIPSASVGRTATPPLPLMRLLSTSSLPAPAQALRALQDLPEAATIGADFSLDVLLHGVAAPRGGGGGHWCKLVVLEDSLLPPAHEDHAVHRLAEVGPRLNFPSASHGLIFPDQSLWR